MVDAVIGGVITAVIEVAKCLAPSVGHQFSYVRNFKTNLDSLKDELKKLAEAKESVDHKVDEARRNVEEIEQQVLTWLTSVENIITEAGKIIEDEERARIHCFNLKTRYQLSRNAEEEVKALVKLQQDGNFPHVSYKTIPQETWLPATIGYESFQSRFSTLCAIKNALADPNVNMVGVYGMGGIGKTTLVREIAMQAENENLFDKVVFAHVSQTPDIDKIQKEIADMLGLQFDDQSQTGRARRLCERLSRVTKILVILDNIWTSLKLEDIGIPFGDDHKGCKLLLTARSVDILSSEKENNFPVGTLNEEEAWSLFKKMVGEDFGDPELQSIACDVANECGGLPIAIVTIARALRNKSKYEWENALLELRRPSKRSLECGVQKEAYSTIELSYNQLEGMELKSIFSLCGLMQDNSIISDLLKYSMGLGLLESIETMEEARKRICTLVRKLKDKCLLLDNQWGTESFSMHDVVCDVALSIASRDQHIILKREKIDSIRWPDKNTLQSCSAIVFHNGNITELPEGLECPQLKFFFYRRYGYFGQYSFVKIPENFFAGMIELNVLDLTGLKLLSLPSSICHLVKLRTLCLDYCELEDIGIIGELKTLEILSFISSDIKELPKEIGRLCCLKLLDLSNCRKLEVIPANVISSFSQLEELYMGNSFTKWDDDGPNIKRRKASLHELKHLSHLTNLQLDIKDAKILPKGLFSNKLERYKISIGDKWGRHESNY